MDQFVWQSLLKTVVAVAGAAALLVVALRTQHLLRLLAISVFFALAIIPAISFMGDRWGWRRGASVGAIYGALFAFVAFMVLVLIPGISDFADRVSSNGGEWISNLNSWTEENLSVTLVEQDSAEDASQVADKALTEWADEILGLASSGIGLVFDLATVALFTFYFAADFPRIRRAVLSRVPPHRQRIWGWVTDTAIEQTGGYFYSRVLIMLINGSLFFAAMLLVGMPVAYALPLSLFEAFVATFIPAVGTYIGAAVPILVTLGVEGLASALILLVWTIVYQQVENYFLSPRLSSKTMELNGGIAFGAALAGGAIAGPMGAFMALPIAALITATISNASKTYEVVYEGKAGSPPVGETDTPHEISGAATDRAEDG
ncbi:MAG: AI-2E family transporter [Microthrixaceae bacterium]